MRGYLGLSLVLAAGCLDLNPIFVEPPTSDGTTEGGETTAGPPTGGDPTLPPTTDEGGVTSSGTDLPDTGGGTSVLPGECGDGELNPGEECDDGNDQGNDGCEPVMCVTTAKVVFVSSMTVTGDMGGLQGAHDLCADLAMKAGLPMAPYLAWLSDAKTSPDIFMLKSNYPYIKVNKEMVALNWQTLTSEDLLSAIDLDEFGDPAPILANNPCGAHGVHTSTLASGAADDPVTNCEGWTSASGYADWGDYSATSAKWSLACGYELNCSYEAPIYCFQQ